MPVARRPNEPFAPEPYLDALDQWVGHWVAVKDRQIIAVGTSSSDVAYKLRTLGPSAKGAVMQYVRPSTDGYAIGVG